MDEEHMVAEIPEEVEVAAEEEDWPETPESNDVHDFRHVKMRSVWCHWVRESYAFSSEVALEAQNYAWQGKYCPRKPQYYNRIETGFNWHEYDPHTPYDTYNPPPKIVEGYQFNIFYAGLVDKGKTPSFSVTPFKDDPEFCVLRFKAGPPYEDIGFKIVNRQWKYSREHGFKYELRNTTLRLWFHFKHYRHRRRRRRS